MAAAGKKSKRMKGKTLGINDFLGDAPIGVTIQTKAWPEEEDEYASTGIASRPRAPLVLPSSSRASRGSAYDDDSVPKRPPFMAYISNLPYEVEDGAIADLFASMKVTNLRLPRESDGRSRGFGYVDFEDRESLIAAINLADLVVCNRRIRIEVSNSEDRRTGRRSDRDRDRDYDPERTSGDWRSGPRTEENKEGRRDGDWGRSYGGNREERDGPVDGAPGGWRDARPRDDLPPPNRSYGGRDSYGDRGGFGSRDGDRGGFGSRDGDRGGFGSRDRERDGFGSRDRDAFGSRDRDRDGFGRDGDRGFGRDGDRGFGGGFDRGYGRDGDRDGYRREGYNRGFGGGGFGDRDRDRERDRDRDRDRDADRGEPRTRPKLQLLPRTVPPNPTPPAADSERGDSKNDDNDDGGSVDGRDSADGRAGAGDGNENSSNDSRSADERKPYKPPVPASSIFGQAKPVDTSAREREIEERLMKKAEEMKLRDGYAKEREEKKMWSRDRKDDPDDKRGPPRKYDDRRRDDFSRDEERGRDDKKDDYYRDDRSRGDDRSREDRSRGDRSREDRSRDDRAPYKGSGSSRDSKDSSKEFAATRDSRSAGDFKDGRNSRNSRNDREYSGSRDSKDNSERDSRDGSRKERNFEERPMPKAKDHEPPNFIAQNKFSYLENDDGDDDVSE